MPRSIVLRLADIRDAIVGIQNAAVGADFDAFANDWTMQRAVERGLEIMSEASRHIPDHLKALAPDIPWRQIAANISAPTSGRPGTLSTNICRRLPWQSIN